MDKIMDVLEQRVMDINNSRMAQAQGVPQASSSMIAKPAI
jgi:uncharacterized protein YaaN involved in tellurite resistance